MVKSQAHCQHQEAGGTTYGILISQYLPHIEDAARDVRDGLAAKGDAGGAVVPRAADVELDVLAVGGVLEGDG